MNASFFSCLFETLPASSGCNQAWRRWTPFDACRRSSSPPEQWLKGVLTNTIVSNLLHFLYVINKNFKIIKKVCFHCFILTRTKYTLVIDVIDYHDSQNWNLGDMVANIKCNAQKGYPLSLSWCQWPNVLLFFFMMGGKFPLLFFHSMRWSNNWMYRRWRW